MKYTKKQIEDYFKNGDISETQRDDLIYAIENDEYWGGKNEMFNKGMWRRRHTEIWFI